MARDKTKKKNKVKENSTYNIAPCLKLLVKNDEKLVRMVSNYGANINSDNQFMIRPMTCEKIIENVKTEDAEILQEAKPKVHKSKKRILNLVYFLLNILVIGVVLAIQLSGEENPKESFSEILNINWWFILAAFGTFVFAMLFDQLRIGFLIHKTTGVVRINLSYKVAAIGRHYDTITPLGTGGQPFQIMYMNKYGINPGQGVSIAMGRYIINQIVFFIVVSIFLFRSLVIDPTGMPNEFVSGLATTFCWIGYVLCAVVIIMVTFISFNKRIGASFVAGCLKLLSKIKIGKFRVIKDYNKSFRSIMRNVNIWQRTMKSYSKSPIVLIATILSSIAYYLVYYSMPFFVYCAFAGWHPEAWIKIVTFAMMIDLSSAFNPIPMGIGTADISFTALLGTMGLSKGSLAWAHIIWRCLFYYIYIVQGLFVLSYDYFFGNKRLEKNKEFWMLPMKERINIKMKHEPKNQKE